MWWFARALVGHFPRRVLVAVNVDVFRVLVFVGNKVVVNVDVATLLSDLLSISMSEKTRVSPWDTLFRCHSGGSRCFIN